MKTKHECKLMNLPDSVFIVAMSAVLGLGLAGCQQEGTAEKAGQKIDQAAAKAGQKIDQAAENAGQKLEAAKESLAGKTESATGYMDDSAITAKIKGEILSDPLLKSSQITVTTTSGVVTLGGAVDSQQSIDRALQIARASQSVKSVENSLAVKAAQ